MMPKAVEMVIRGRNSSTTAQLFMVHGVSEACYGYAKQQPAVALQSGGAHMDHGFPYYLHTLQKLGIASQMGKNKFFGRRKTTLSLLWFPPVSSSDAKGNKPLCCSCCATVAVPSYSRATLCSPHRLHFDHSTISSLSEILWGLCGTAPDVLFL